MVLILSIGSDFSTEAADVFLETVDQMVGGWGLFGLSTLPGGFLRGVGGFHDAALCVYRV